MVLSVLQLLAKAFVDVDAKSLEIFGNYFGKDRSYSNGKRYLKLSLYTQGLVKMIGTAKDTALARDFFSQHWICNDEDHNCQVTLADSDQATDPANEVANIQKSRL